MLRLHQVVLIASTLLGSWLGMQQVHEFGHVVGAWLTGGKVSAVVLHPLAISRTDLSHNPHALAVVWAGPLVGILLPLLAWSCAAILQLRSAFALRFFAGFCLLANGLYISFGSLDSVGDAGVMMKNGSSTWQLWSFGALCAPLGLWLWHDQGINFGFGTAKGNVDIATAYGSLAVFCVLVAVGMTLTAV